MATPSAPSGLHRRGCARHRSMPAHSILAHSVGGRDVGVLDHLAPEDGLRGQQVAKILPLYLTHLPSQPPHPLRTPRPPKRATKSCRVADPTRPPPPPHHPPPPGPCSSRAIWPESLSTMGCG